MMQSVAEWSLGRITTNEDTRRACSSWIENGRNFRVLLPGVRNSAAGDHRAIAQILPCQSGAEYRN